MDTSIKDTLFSLVIVQDPYFDEERIGVDHLSEFDHAASIICVRRFPRMVAIGDLVYFQSATFRRLLICLNRLRCQVAHQLDRPKWPPTPPFLLFYACCQCAIFRKALLYARAVPIPICAVTFHWIAAAHCIGLCQPNCALRRTVKIELNPAIGQSLFACKVRTGAIEFYWVLTPAFRTLYQTWRRLQGGAASGKMSRISIFSSGGHRGRSAAGGLPAQQTEM